MWLINTETTDDTETLVCHVCHEPFHALELAWLAWPVVARRGVPAPTVWTHRKCLEGQALLIFGTGEYRMRRADFAIKSVLQRLLFKPAL
jgi:hypothetical protein